MAIRIQVRGMIAIDMPNGSIAVCLKQLPDPLTEHRLSLSRNGLPEDSFTLRELVEIQSALSDLISEEHYIERTQCPSESDEPLR